MIDVGCGYGLRIYGFLRTSFVFLKLHQFSLYSSNIVISYIYLNLLNYRVFFEILSLYVLAYAFKFLIALRKLLILCLSSLNDLFLFVVVCSFGGVLRDGWGNLITGLFWLYKMSLAWTRQRFWRNHRCNSILQIQRSTRVYRLVLQLILIVTRVSLFSWRLGRSVVYYIITLDCRFLVVAVVIILGRCTFVILLRLLLFRRSAWRSFLKHFWNFAINLHLHLHSVVIRYWRALRIVRKLICL